MDLSVLFLRWTPGHVTSQSAQLCPDVAFLRTQKIGGLFGDFAKGLPGSLRRTIVFCEVLEMKHDAFKSSKRSWQLFRKVTTAQLFFSPRDWGHFIKII